MPCASDEVRGLWWDQRCPTNTDALQIATEALLDAADHIVGTGLAGVGYTVLAMPSCPLLQMPSHREAIAHYFAERGLSLVFAPVVEDDPGASLLSDILFFGADRTVRGAAARAAHRHEEARAPTGEAPPAEAAGSCAQLYLQKLASLSGLGGWNDPRTHLPARPHLASARLNRSRVEPTRPLAIGPPIDVVATELRSHFALACVRAAPLILSTPPHRLSRDARRIVTDTVALSIQSNEGASRPERIEVPSRAHSRFGTGSRLEGWVRRSADGSSAVLLILNHEHVPASAEIPWHALRPLSHQAAWAAFAFHGGRRGTRGLEHVLIPPRDCVLVSFTRDAPPELPVVPLPTYAAEGEAAGWGAMGGGASWRSVGLGGSRGGRRRGRDDDLGDADLDSDEARHWREGGLGGGSRIAPLLTATLAVLLLLGLVWAVLHACQRRGVSHRSAARSTRRAKRRRAEHARLFGEGFSTGSDTEYYYVIGDAPAALSATTVPRKGFAYSRGAPGGATSAAAQSAGDAPCLEI